MTKHESENSGRFSRVSWTEDKETVLTAEAEIKLLVDVKKKKTHRTQLISISEGHIEKDIIHRAVRGRRSLLQ